VNPPLHATRRDLFRLAALGGIAGSTLGCLALGNPADALAASTFSPIQPPATPLAVRSPYLSAWLRADTLPGNWPTFWAGAVTAITGIVRVDGQPYVFMGAPSGGWPLATQSSLAVTATRSTFTITAGPVWVQLAATSNFATVAGQDGAQASGFYLQYSAADNAWAFAMVAADSANATAIRAVSPLPPRADGWTHLVGVRDASAGRLRLFVDGELVADVAKGASWAAGGAFTIGRGKWNGGDADHFPGRIDQVKVWTRALTEADVRAIA
jgi:hypothetical protein